ncbi:50S ribosomal protein L22 [bacterium]|nr:50S ribosomal protein L22 [bacterium]
MKAIARNVRISPKKVNLVAGLVRRKNVKEALNILKFTPKKGAKILYKVLHSAVANAENNFKQKPDLLVIKEIIVTEGPTFKRSVPVSRGRVHPILKRNSHITVTVGLEDTKEEKDTKEKNPTDKK